MVKPSSSSVSPGQTLFLPLAITGVCWYLSPNDITPVQGILAYLLLMIPWASYLSWKQSKGRDFPVFTLLASMHWVYFAQPLFFGNRRIPGFTAEAQQELITMTLAMAVTGVVCLGLGMRVRIVRWEPATLPDLTDSPISWPYLRVVMFLGILMGLRGCNPYAFGEGGVRL